jgi:hypothetical protein
MIKGIKITLLISIFGLSSCDLDDIMKDADTSVLTKTSIQEEQSEVEETVVETTVVFTEEVESIDTTNLTIATTTSNFLRIMEEPALSSGIMTQIQNVEVNDMIINNFGNLVLVGQAFAKDGIMMEIDGFGDVINEGIIELENSTGSSYNEVKLVENDQYVVSGYTRDNRGTLNGGYGLFSNEGQALMPLSVVDLMNTQYISGDQLDQFNYCTAINETSSDAMENVAYLAIWPSGAFAKSRDSKMTAALRDRSGNCTGIGWKRTPGNGEAAILMSLSNEGTTLVGERFLNLSGSKNRPVQMHNLSNGNLMLLVKTTAGAKMVEIDLQGHVINEAPTFSAGVPVKMVQAADDTWLVLMTQDSESFIVKVDGNGDAITSFELPTNNNPTGIAELNDGSIAVALNTKIGEMQTTLYRIIPEM